MDLQSISAGLSPVQLAMAFAITLLAGFVKGAAGFAMPTIMISGLASFLPPELALAGLILPTLLANLIQALRNGAALAWESLRRFRLFLGVGALFLVASAQLVRVIDERVFFAMIGLPITAFGVMQLAGYRPRMIDTRHRPAEIALGALAGTIGGISGVWGPPLVLYLTARDTPKLEQMRILGVAFGLGSVLLTLTHLQTGLLNAKTLPFSAALLVPAVCGLLAGQWLHARLDQQSFRRLTLLVLIVAGLNLLRRALS